MKRDKKWLWGLVIFALATRLPYILPDTIPFSFDHGRDSMAVLHLIKTCSLKFIGPWTSIPGLFFGPGWYYLLAPAYVLGSGNPVAAVGLMLVLGLIQIWLAFKYFGVFEATIMATAPIWMILSTGAANPFPMTLVALLIVILLKQIEAKRKTSLKQVLALGLLVSLGFHFSSALAVFYLLIIPLIFWLRKIKFNLKQSLAGLTGFLLPFIPQLLFELKHNFLQTRALLDYFSQGESQTVTPGKIKIVTTSTLHELGLAVLPQLGWLSYLGWGLLGTGLIYLLLKKKRWSFWLELILLTLIPLIGFWFLHYNVWYVYGLLPAAVVAVGYILRSSPKFISLAYLTLLLLTPFYSLYQYFSYNREITKNSAAFLPVKLRVLNYIYDQAEGRPFSSYHYLASIYDYPYQYLYFWQAFKGKPLPVEFSYKPGEITYVPEKKELLNLLPQPKTKAETIFLIVEKPENVYHYPIKQWLSEIKYGKIVSKKAFGPEVEVWQAKPL